MARPARVAITSTQQSWDADVDDNFISLFDEPSPIPEHSGDESDLETTYAAAQHDRCMIWVNHTTMNWCLYYSDGTSWHILVRDQKHLVIPHASGVLYFGTAQDVNIYRQGADLIRTNDGLWVDLGLALRAVTTVTAATYTADEQDCSLLGDTSSNSITIDLPASPQAGHIYFVKKVHASNVLTIDGNGNNIDGLSTIDLLVDDASLLLKYDSSEWRIFASHRFPANHRLLVSADSPYTATIHDRTILANTSSGSITITLPAAHPAGTRITMKKINASNTMTVDPGTDSIDGSGADKNFTTIFRALTVESDGSNWFIVDGYLE